MATAKQEQDGNFKKGDILKDWSMKGLRMKKDDDHRKKYAGECFNCMDLSENNCPLNLGELTFDNFCTLHFPAQGKEGC